MNLRCLSLKQMERIQILSIVVWLAHVTEEEHSRTILSPLKQLKNVRHLTLDGKISQECVQELREHCSGSVITDLRA